MCTRSHRAPQVFGFSSSFCILHALLPACPKLGFIRGFLWERREMLTSCLFGVGTWYAHQERALLPSKQCFEMFPTNRRPSTQHICWPPPNKDVHAGRSSDILDHECATAEPRISLPLASLILRFLNFLFTVGCYRLATLINITKTSLRSHRKLMQSVFLFGYSLAFSVTVSRSCELIS